MASEDAKKAAQKHVDARLAPMMRALKIVRETNDKGRQALKAWAGSKTRPAPAATDTGLVTVAPTYITYNPVYHVTYEGADPKRGYVYVQTNTCPASVEALQTVAWDTWGRGLRYSLRSQPEPGDEALVYRWRAEELLAAERADKRIWMEKAAIEAERVERLEADNAAQAARIKELEAALDSDPSGSDLWRYWSRKACEASQKYVDEVDRAEALEAKLAAAEKALEPFADHANDRAVDDTGWRDKETVKIVVSIGDLRNARAVLGGKPS